VAVGPTAEQTHVVHLSSLVEMVESGFADRVLLQTGGEPVSGERFGVLVRSAADDVRGRYDAVVYVGENHPLLPVAVFAAAWAGVPFVPLNYRLEDARLNELLSRQPGGLVLADASSSARLTTGQPVRVFDEWLVTLDDAGDRREPASDDDAVAIVLYTSGTTAAPKAALLRHRHLMAYLLETVEFGSADEDEAVLISVPPYHVAGMANLLSNVFAGRRLVYLRAFDPQQWLATVRDERITHAMVVPTMLARIVEALDGRPADASTLRTLSYGGAKVSSRVLAGALEAFPETGFVNAYGLTETASTIAVLGPEDHRTAVGSDDPDVRRRLASVGRPLPSVEVQIRDEADGEVGPSERGMVYVRGPQIAGEYSHGSLLDADGWFCTRDLGWLDADGYLFIEGRADDTIIRGGENIAPAEIEEVLLQHPAVAEACVVGVPDEEWGQRIVAAVVRRSPDVDADALREHVRRVLRGSKTPDEVVFYDTLPHTDTGKLLRRQVAAQLSG
jgi:acyl-CoA synthetase (AMP-forming)/AMP-acid ligase II